MFARAHEDVGEIEDGFGETGLDCDRTALRLAGGVQSRLLDKREAEVVKEGRVGRHDGEGSPDSRKSVRAVIVAQRTEEVQRIGLARVLDQDAAIEFRGDGQVCAGVMAYGLGEQIR